MIDVRHLTYTTGTQTILSDLSVTFQSHKITGIVGPNGCGKSTLLAHIARLLPSSGTIFLDDTAVEAIPARAYARILAVLSQHRESASEELTAADVVLMGRYPYKKRFENYSSEDRAIARAMMEQTGTLALREKKLGHMSGGERQRVFIAKAFAQQPQYLLLDEPTNHLDVKYKIALMEELRRFPETVIIVLHDLGLAARYCDHIVILKNGSLVTHGAPRDVLTPARLKEVFEVSFRTQEQDGIYYLYY
ncbi:ABC transporter ATP-binding protein [Selenomonas noxia]|uniref:ABC transporter ATP-binding protein n=1 Tax=Selenomonas noxia TaxID=135083 RepID=UPI0023F4908A|nr:ABC transporter ATP-binding protein [Selenomonas noxia]